MNLISVIFTVFSLHAFRHFRCDQVLKLRSLLIVSKPYEFSSFNCEIISLLFGNGVLSRGRVNGVFLNGFQGSIDV